MTTPKRPKHRVRDNAHGILTAAWLMLSLTIIVGCGQQPPAATVEGTLRLNGKPLDNCLITFLPMAKQETQLSHSTGLTDRQGGFRLCFTNQQEGVAIGTHRVIIQDMSVSTGVRRRDHGTIDAEPEQSTSVTPVRHSRVPQEFTSVTTSPLSKEVKPGHQVIDLEL